MFFFDQALSTINKELHLKNSATPVFPYHEELSDYSDTFDSFKNKKFLL